MIIVISPHTFRDKNDWLHNKECVVKSVRALSNLWHCHLITSTKQTLPMIVSNSNYVYKYETVINYTRQQDLYLLFAFS